MLAFESSSNDKIFKFVNFNRSNNLNNMRKILFFPQTLLGLMIVMCLSTISCGNTASEKRLSQTRDSIQTADSIEKAEAALREQALKDSLRTDSLIRARVPKMKNFFILAPQYGGVKFNDFAKISKILRNLGYSETTKKRKTPGFYDEETMEFVAPKTKTDYVWICDSLVNIKIVTSDADDKITITFGDNLSQNLFMESVRDAGFKSGVGETGGMPRGKAWYHPKGDYVCGVWIDETPGQCVLHHVWTN